VPLYWVRALVSTVYTTNPKIDSASITAGANRSAHHDGTAASDLYQDLERKFATQRYRIGAPYSVVFTLANASGAVSITPKLGGTSGTARTADGEYTETINAGSTDQLLTFSATASGQTCDIDNISVKLTISSWAAVAGGGNDAWIRLSYDASDEADFYNAMKLRIVSGAGAGTTEYTVTDYLGNTAGKFHQCDVDPTWANGTPDNTSIVEIYQDVTDEEVLSIYMFDRDGDQNWLTWHLDTSVVRAPVGGDEDERTLWADGTHEPRISYNGLIDTALYAANSGVASRYPQDWWTLGVPAPVATPIVALNGTADDANESPETRNYVYTFVTAQEEEGPPSPVSEDIEWRSGQTVDLSVMDTAPAGRFNITRKRIYRVNTGLVGAAFQFVAEIDIADTTFNDDVPSIELAEDIISTNYDMPPIDLHHIIEMPNGMLVGLSGNELCFSEPYQPHAWPIEYRQALHDVGVALGAYGSTCVIGTKSEPVIAHGVHPDSISMEKLESPYPCVSAESMVDMGDFVLYAAPDGLVKSQSQSVELITKNSITAAQWQALVPTTFKAFRWDHFYVCFYNDGSKKGFMYDPMSDEFLTLSAYASAGFIQPQTGKLYIFDAGEIKEWEGGTAYTSVWESKVFTAASKTVFTAARIDAESYSSVTLKIYAGGSLVETKTVTSDEPFRINTSPQERFFKIRLETTDVINAVEIATSMQELLEQSQA
jgi:hypothetical protein